MVKRPLRLSRQDFSAVTADKTAKKAVSEHFSVVSSGAAAGCAVVVSKKVTKSSIERHLVKRRTREAMKPFFSDSRGLIVYARAGSASLPYIAIVEEVTPLLQKVTT